MDMILFSFTSWDSFNFFASLFAILLIIVLPIIVAISLIRI